MNNFYIPDNYDLFEMNEREMERIKRMNRRNAIAWEEEEMEYDIPFKWDREDEE